MNSEKQTEREVFEALKKSYWKTLSETERAKMQEFFDKETVSKFQTKRLREYCHISSQETSEDLFDVGFAMAMRFIAEQLDLILNHEEVVL